MLLFLYVPVVKTIKYIFGVFSESKLSVIFKLTFFKKNQTFLYIILYVDFKKNILKNIRAQIKKNSWEFKVAMVSQPAQTIGLVPVGPWLCMLSFRKFG